MEPLELPRGSCCSSGPGLSPEMSPGLSPGLSPGGCEEREAWLGPGGSPRPCPYGAPAEGAAPELREPPTEDDIYCRCLSRTLCHTATPVTVGFYAPCGHRLESLLAKVTGGSGTREFGNSGIRESGNSGMWEFGNPGIRECGNSGIGSSGFGVFCARWCFLKVWGLIANSIPILSSIPNPTPQSQIPSQNTNFISVPNPIPVPNLIPSQIPNLIPVPNLTSNPIPSTPTPS
ncbi:uncharacterized protein LOC120498874 [Passer montanus]|uniref:uncharacterized protein LOC120498874 n=1 Tax=Passer montanus TaxID=9160 RepID=UPI001961C116|nr:uncharacterized protein LOC120498874 [Passer montanus]